MFAKFDEIPSTILQDIKKTKRYGRTVRRSDGRSVGWTDNVKTVYSLRGGGGIIISPFFFFYFVLRNY